MRSASFIPLFIGLFVATSATAYAQDTQLYFDIKRVGTELARKEQLLLGQGDDLYICETWSDSLGTAPFSSRQNAYLLDVAGAIVRWRTSLAKWGPKDAWQSRLIQAEQVLVAKGFSQYNRDSIKDILREGKALVADLNELGVGRRLFFKGGCGAGGFVDIVFRTDPARGRVSIISEFEYELCRLKGTHNDHELCRAWRVAKEPEAVSGAYYLQVNWPGRVEGPDRYDLNPWSGKLKDVYWLRF